MIKPKDVLKVARWTHPEGDWDITAGIVWDFFTQGDQPYGDGNRTFDLRRTRDSDAVRMKLQKDYGWRVTQVTRSGRKEWRADNGKGGTAESPSLQKLLVVLVDRVSGEGDEKESR